MALEAQVHGLLLVDKPRGVSSHDVVARARRALQTRRIGHTGTLDPMATGLLVLAVGEGTKLVAYLTEHDKRYECTVQLGTTTDSLDADGTITERAAVPALSREALDQACRELEQCPFQVPPMVSAVRVDGERLYKRARRGEVLELAPRPVRLHQARVVHVEAECVSVDVACGKGFYVRAFARDLAQRLGTVGHLSALRRTQVGDDAVSGAVTWARLDQASRGDEPSRADVLLHVIPLSEACARLPTVHLDAVGIDHARHGRAVPLANVLDVLPAPDQPVVLRDHSETPIAIARLVGEAIVVSRGFVSTAAVSEEESVDGL